MSAPTWCKDPGVYEASPGSDDVAGKAWETRYTLTDGPDDGLHAVVDMTFYVKDLDWQADDDERGKRLAVACMTQYTVCRDLDDVGGTEEWSDIEYDDNSPFDPKVYDGIGDGIRAEASAKRLAEIDYAWALAWDGRSRIHN